jgi:hypothetical protein
MEFLLGTGVTVPESGFHPWIISLDILEYKDKKKLLKRVLKWGKRSVA